jgi:DNA-binding MarR family transcriptional regulator
MNNKIAFKHISVHDAPEQSPGFLLWQISISWRTAIESVLKPMNLTHPQFVVLATLGWLTQNGERVTQAAVGKMAKLDPNTISQILRGLELKKWIKRKQSADVRAKNPELTSKGAEFLAKALPAVEKADAQFFKKLNTQEVRNMMEIFEKLAMQPITFI